MANKQAAYWVSCNKFTILVETEDRVIIKAAPIARKFIGQNLNNLFNWFKKFGGFKYAKLKL